MNIAEPRSMIPRRPHFSAILYAALLAAFLGAIGGVLQLGRHLEPVPATVGRTVLGGHVPGGPDWSRMLLQIAVVIGASRAFGWILRRLHQPQVVGETIAGIFLGPSVLGWLAPRASALLFPASSLNLLGALSQVGLTLFMFLVGLELDLSALRSKSHTAVMTSHVGIVVPFFLGCALSLALYSELAPANVPFMHFALFVGICMSITAFPVLARILTERGMQSTTLGSVALACAAIDDITAWSILAGVVALVRADATLPLWATLGGSALFCLLMIFGVRPGLAAVSARRRSDAGVGEGALSVIFLLLLVSACITEYLGIHALFGAFLMGTVMPRDAKVVAEVRKKVNHVTVVLLLPIFFALTGLRTNVTTLASGYMWLYGALILIAAVTGKFGGSLVSARASGCSWREAVALGVLMNTRGLMELVALNIGYDIGILSRPLFTTMVLMALFTTMMTTPILDWLARRDGARSPRGTGALGA